MKQMFMVINGIVGGIIAACFGGWDAVLQTLVLFMAIDWITGGILLPAVFKKSPKSENGALESLQFCDGQWHETGRCLAKSWTSHGNVSGKRAACTGVSQ